MCNFQEVTLNDGVYIFLFCTSTSCCIEIREVELIVSPYTMD